MFLDPFPITNGSGPSRIVTGPDGNLWFTELFAGRIGRITPAGMLTEFPIPDCPCQPAGITVRPDGALWFTDLQDAIRRVATDGSFTKFAVGEDPRNITTGPDGALWFADEELDLIGRLTTAGNLTEFPVAAAGSAPTDITTGPDGNLWFTEQGANRIASMDPDAPGALVTLTLTSAGNGAVAADPPGTVTGATTRQYAAGTVVTLTPQPTPGNLFTRWDVDGTYAGWADPVTITMDADHAVQATFVATPTFGDVLADASHAGPVGELAARGVINGCDKEAVPPLFCPAEPTLRHQMAALIVRAMPGWQDETWPLTFTDPTDDAELMRRVATLQHHNVAQGYQDEVCAAQGKAPPCFGPLDNVAYGQVLLFIARAMVAKGYWTLQPDNRDLFPDQNGEPGADPDSDRQTLDHRMVVTYVHYVGAPPDVDITPGVPFRRMGVDNGGWGDPSSRAWFGRALWPALDSYFGTDQSGLGGNVP